MAKKSKGFPGPMTRAQMGAYKGIQKAEVYPGGLDIRAGNEMGFRSKGGIILGVCLGVLKVGRKILGRNFRKGNFFDRKNYPVVDGGRDVFRINQLDNYRVKRNFSLGM